MLTRLLRLLAPLAPRRHPRSFPIPFRSHFSTLYPLPFPLTRPKNPAQAISRQPAPSGGGLARDSSPFTPTRIRPLATPACPATPRSARPPASPAASVFPLRSASSSLALWERVGVRVFPFPSVSSSLAPWERAGVRVFRATRRDSAPSPQRTLQVRQATAPPHLKSFLEKTLTRAKPPHFDPSNHPQQRTAQTPTSSSLAPRQRVGVRVPPFPSVSSSLARWERVGVRIFRATRRDSAPSPQRTPQVLPKCPPPHLKSFLEETLIAREAPTSARPTRRHHRPIPTPAPSRPALTSLPSPLSPSSTTPRRPTTT